MVRLSNDERQGYPTKQQRQLPPNNDGMQSGDASTESNSLPLEANRLRVSQDLDMRLLRLLDGGQASKVQAYAVYVIRDDRRDLSTSQHLRGFMNTRSQDSIWSALEEAHQLSQAVTQSQVDAQNPTVHRNTMSDAPFPMEAQPGPRTSLVHRARPVQSNASKTSDDMASYTRPAVKRGRPRKVVMSIAETPDQASTEGLAATVAAPVAIRQRETTCLQIGDSERVKEFMFDRLRKLQQLSCKKLSKAWIKAICPKKQTKYPYQSKSSQPGLPHFWPSTECRWKEPDHIHRPERVRLVHHLLTLRPSLEDFQVWNGGKIEPKYKEIWERYGWTAFLREIAPIDFLDNVNLAKKQHVEEDRMERRRHLTQLYQLAELEEGFLAGCYDATHEFQWTEPEELDLPKQGSKRKSSATSGRRQKKASTPDSSMTATMTMPAKRRCRRANVQHMPTQAELTLNPSGSALTEDDTAAETDDAATPPNRAATVSFASSLGGPDEADNVASIPDGKPSDPQRELQVWQHPEHRSFSDGHVGLRPLPTEAGPQAFGWNGMQYSDAQPTVSFDSTISGPNSEFYPTQTEPAYSPFPGDCSFSLPQQHQNGQAHRAHLVTSVPEPRYDIVPITPMFLPGAMPHFQATSHPGMHFETVQDMHQYRTASTFPEDDAIHQTGYQYPPATCQVSTEQQVQQQFTNGLTPPYPIQQAQVQSEEYQFFSADAGFNAAARDMRGFTGYGSGVGSGHPT